MKKWNRSALGKTVEGLDPNMAKVFIPWALKNPRYMKTFLTLLGTHLRTREIRERLKRDGVKVPPFLILSITSKCNLNCEGCFAAAAGTTKIGRRTLSFDGWHRIIEEARNLGVFGFVIAGGEPFLFPRLLDLCSDFRDSFFIILTNGTVMNEGHFEWLKEASNVSVLVSIEGSKAKTDERRGNG